MPKKLFLRTVKHGHLPLALYFREHGASDCVLKNTVRFEESVRWDVVTDVGC